MQNDDGQRTRRVAVAVAAIYFVAAFAWIHLSDQVGAVLFASGDAFALFQSFKGTAFVLVTAVLVYVLVQGRYAPADAGGSGRGLPIGLMLAGLVLATAVPLMAVIGYNLIRETRGALEDARGLVAGVADSTATEVRRFLQVRQRVLSALANGPGFDEKNPTDCRELLRAVSSLHPRAIAVALQGSGGPTCHSGDTNLFAAVVAGRSESPAIASPFRAAAAGGWLVALTYPLATAGGRADRIIRVVIPVQAVEGLLITAPLPPGATAGLVSREGVVLAHWPENNTVGERIRDAAALERARADHSVVAASYDGVERLYAVRAADGFGPYAVVEVSPESIYAPVRERGVRSTLIALAVLFSGAWVVTLISRRITGPMRRLADAAQAAGEGRFDLRAPEAGPAEVAGVAAQFNHMLERLPMLQAELRSSEERYRTLLEKISRNVPGMIFQLRMTPQGEATVPFASHAIGLMFEASAEDARRDARVLNDRIHPDDAERIARATEDSLRQLSPFSGEYRVVLPSRGVRHYLTYSQPELEDDGSVLWHGCTVDVTDLNTAREELEKLNVELEHRVEQRTRQLAASNQALESFSYSIAHDLRAPLTAIGGFSGALAQIVRSGDKERAEHMAARVVANAKKMLAMIDGLLTLSRSGRGELHGRDVDLHEMVQSVLAEIYVPHGMRVEVEPLPLACVESVTLRQVFWNLLSNAVKFASSRDHASVEVGMRILQEEAAFFVRDNGTGFDPAQAGRLFSPFARLHKEAEFGGTGVGLAIVKRVVEWHGGRVWAESAPQQGATFWFTLPLERVRTSRGPAGAPDS